MKKRHERFVPPDGTHAIEPTKVERCDYMGRVCHNPPLNTEQAAKIRACPKKKGSSAAPACASTAWPHIEKDFDMRPFKKNRRELSVPGRVLLLMQITDCSDYPREMLRLLVQRVPGFVPGDTLMPATSVMFAILFVFRELLGHEKRHDGVVTLHHRLIGRVTFADGKSRQGFV